MSKGYSVSEGTDAQIKQPEHVDEFDDKHYIKVKLDDDSDGFEHIKSKARYNEYGQKLGGGRRKSTRRSSRRNSRKIKSYRRKSRKGRKRRRSRRYK